MRWLIALIVTVALVIPGNTADAEQEIGRGWLTLLDERGRVLLRTGHELSPGDVFICPDNVEYGVRRTVGTFAYAARIRPAQRACFLTDEALAAVQPAQGNKAIVYHSHSDESYVPSDGTSTIDGRGGIHDVGQTLVGALSERGLDADHIDDLHNPHDAGAYDRSRRSVVDKIDEETAVLLDVHRDTGPPGAYEEEIDGETATQILLVVGRQNPNINANAGFARRVKEAADEKYPGLIRGILFARGKYNQDIHPRAVLVEVGTHHSRKQDADRAVTLLADVLPEVLGATPDAGIADPEGRGGILNALGIIAATALAGGTYLVVATGSPGEAKAKLRNFISRDLGLGRRRNGNTDDDSAGE